eukprot:2067589-Prymnesium_polylepis.1
MPRPRCRAACRLAAAPRQPDRPAADDGGGRAQREHRRRGAALDQPAGHRRGDESRLQRAVRA